MDGLVRETMGSVLEKLSLKSLQGIGTCVQHMEISMNLKLR